MIEGINHLTLAVSDLDRSFIFYVDYLGMKPIARWDAGAYLLAGTDWVCLSLDSECKTHPNAEYTHVAFTVSIEYFNELSTSLLNNGFQKWKENRSEGESLYILDPDFHKLEIHSGNLQSRIECPERQSLFWPNYF